MAGKDNTPLEFPMRINFDFKGFENIWTITEKRIQAIIDKSKFDIKLKIDHQAISNTLEAMRELNQLTNQMNSASIKSSPASMLKAKLKGDAEAARIALEGEARAKKILATVDNEVAMSAARLAKARDQSTLSAHKVLLSEEKLQQAKLKTSQATARATATSERHNKSLISQMGLLNGIPQLLTSYVSVLGAFRLLRNLREVTAEFELQRVALAAIIQSKSKADELFAQTVELGLESPFQIRELITYTKQLAAYRVETENLFDTTKRLADISAGLGVDMSRLILAYGQVRAASVLRGQELRQFTEAGIPLVDLLAKKFSTLRGELVSTGDVFKLISERAVPFSMIKEIFEDMTNAGGTFYNMQAIQARTLHGVWSNLRDAYDKMFMQMGNANMGLLKGIGNTLRKLADNWEVVLDILSKTVAAYSVYRLALIANNALIGKELKTTLSSVMAAKAKEAALLRQSAVYRKLSGAEAARIWTSSHLTKTDITQLHSSGKLTADMALRMIVTKKLTVAQQQQLVTLKLLTQAQVDHARSASATKLMLVSLTGSVRAFAASMWASASAMLANPMTWLIALLAGVTAGISKVIKRNREYNELTKQMTIVTRDYAEQLTEAYEKVSETVSAGLVAGADDTTVTRAINSLQEILVKNDIIKALVQDRLKSITNEVTKLEELKKIYESLKKAISDDEMPGLYSTAAKQTGSLVDDDIIKNTAKVTKRIADVTNLMYSLRAAGVGVSSIQKKFDEASKAFKAGTLDLKGFQKAVNELRSESSKKEETFDLETKLVRLQKALIMTGEDMESFTKVVQANLTEINGQRIDWGNADRWGLTDDNFNALQLRLGIMEQMFVESAQNIDRGVFRNLYGEKFQIPLLKPGGVGRQLDELEESYNKKIKQMQSQGKLLTLPELKPATSERDSGADLKALYDKTIEKQKEINQQISFGNKELAAGLPLINQQVKDLEFAVKWFGKWEEKKSAIPKDPRVEALENELTLMKEAYEKYKEYSKLKGSIAAQEQVRKMYKDKFTIPGFGIALDQEDLSRMFNKALELFETYGKGSAEAYFKTWNDQADAAFKGMAETTKEELKKLGEDISKIQKANNFYKEMLDATGDEELSKRVALQVTGLETGDIAEKLKQQLQKAAGEYAIEVPLVAGQVDVAGFIQELEDSLLDGRLGEEGKKVIEEYLSAYVENEQSQMKELFAGLAKYETYESKRAKIVAQGQALITLAVKKGASDQVAVARNMMETQLADLEYENFKTTEAYVDMFGDLNSLSIESLSKIRAKLIELSETMGAKLSPTNMKELVSKMDDVNKKIIELNPFQAWRDSLEEVKRLEKTVGVIEKSVEFGKKIGLDPVKLNIMITLLENLQKELDKTKAEGRTAFQQITQEINAVYTAAGDVVTGVKEIFEEFGIGEDTIAGKSLNLLETIGKGVMKVIQATAATAGKAVSAVEKASIILTIISVVLQIAMKIYSLFSKEARLSREIEALTKDVEHLKDMYAKLELESITDPASIKRLEQELDIRKQMLAVTRAQMEVEIPGMEKASREYLLRALGLKMVADKNHLFDFAAGFFVGGFNYWMRLLTTYGKIKKYNEYIEEVNQRLDYQGELYKIINSDVNSIAKTAQARVANLKEQNRLIQKQIDAQIALGRKMDVEKLMKLQEELAKNQTDISYAFLDALHDATGDIFKNLADSITKALAEAFENGESSALAFERTIDDVMRNVVIDLWKANVLPAMLQPVMGEIYSALGLGPDGKVKPGSTPDYFIDSSEAARIASEANKSKKDILASFSGLESIFDIFGGGSKNLTGIAKAVGSMSEESALTLSAVWNSSLYYTVGMYNIQTKMLSIMEAYVTSMRGGKESQSDLAKLYSIQAGALAQLEAINKNTGATATNTAALVDAIQKLTVSGGKTLNVKLID